MKRISNTSQYFIIKNGVEQAVVDNFIKRKKTINFSKNRYFWKWREIEQSYRNSH